MRQSEKKRKKKQCKTERNAQKTEGARCFNRHTNTQTESGKRTMFLTNSNTQQYIGWTCKYTIQPSTYSATSIDSFHCCSVSFESTRIIRSLWKENHVLSYFRLKTRKIHCKPDLWFGPLFSSVVCSYVYANLSIRFHFRWDISYVCFLVLLRCDAIVVLCVSHIHIFTCLCNSYSLSYFP